MKLRLNKSLHLILNIIAPIIFGFFIYVFYRSNDIIVFDWLCYFNIEMIINSTRVSNILFRHPVMVQV